VCYNKTVEGEQPLERKEGTKMKNLKIALIATFITALLIVSCACAVPACAEGKNEKHEVIETYYEGTIDLLNW